MESWSNPLYRPRKSKKIEDAFKTKRIARCKSHLGCETRNGKVILTGSVRSWAERGKPSWPLARAGESRRSKISSRLRSRPDAICIKPVCEEF